MKNIKQPLIRTALFALALLSAACDSTPTAEICVSIPPQAYLVKRIAGESTPVTVMIPPGSAPPTYAPSASQIRDLHECKLYVLNGHPDFHFEAMHINPFLKGHPEVLTVSMADSADLMRGDSHIWLSPAIMRAAAGKIVKKLCLLYPGRQDELNENYRLLIRDIDDLDVELRGVFASLQGAKFMTLHPSWGYFSREYGLQQVSIHHENKAPAAQELAELIEQAKADSIRILFIQKEFSFEQLSVISQEIDASIIPLDPLNESWLENLRQTGRIFQKAMNEH
ncbi:MAG: zinc ABC transporter substrate-binding protein [Candidatus Marinimicrobia bacterium]|nr:zinc ABC transporter substrate-binding protein [Candidatus Neomarinimicrobiota bacterium]